MPFFLRTGPRLTGSAHRLPSHPETFLFSVVRVFCELCVRPAAFVLISPRGVEGVFLNYHVPVQGQAQEETA